MADPRHIPLPPVEETGERLPNPEVEHRIVSNHNRWSRTVFNFKDLSSDTWHELSFQIHWHPDESSRGVHDLAAIGIDFQTEDGSSIDFGYVPGLTRAQIDPHHFYVAGPDYFDRSSDPTHFGVVRCTFLIPHPAQQLSVTLRSWRNSHPFEIRHLKLQQFPHVPPTAQSDDTENLTAPEHEGSPSLTSRGGWKVITRDSVWFSYAVLPGHPLTLRGQLINEAKVPDGILARVIFRDAAGQELPPPYEDVSFAPDIGAFIDIPSHRQARRFTLELPPPPLAASVEIGFQSWRDEASMELVTPLEVSLGEDLLLENVSADDLLDATNFVRELLKKLRSESGHDVGKDNRVSTDHFLDRDALKHLFTIHDKFRTVQHGETTALKKDQLSLQGFPDWPLPPIPDWTEDPFQSSAWRLEYQSLGWLADLTKSQNPGEIARAIDLALSWSQSNPWGAPKDPLSAYPLSLAVRAEVLLHLLSLSVRLKKAASPAKQNMLFAEVIRHAVALGEIVSQNLFSHSVLQIRAACALLALSRALPRFPLAPYWTSVALAHLDSSFDQVIGQDGSLVEQSQQLRLELISIGMILVDSLKRLPSTQNFRNRLMPRLKTCLQALISITDPSGMLPSFGDMPRGHHHAPWLRRLISGYGRTFLLDPSFAEELAYPTGGRAFMSHNACLIGARSYERKPDWGYLCASFSEQRHENGHFDCTSFVYSASGMRWITDPGGSSLSDAGPARQYLISSRAHNVAIPDGREQSAGKGWVEANVTLDDSHVFRIGTNVYGPDYAHSRTFVCPKDLNAIAVFDRFTTGPKPLVFEGLLHFDEDIAVALANANLALGFRDEDRLRIVPQAMTGQFAGLEVENGRNDRAGALQGFLSHRSGGLQPSNVLRYRFSGHGDVCGGVILANSRTAFGKMSELLAVPMVKQLINPPSAI